jgi:hypothetical protein
MVAMPLHVLGLSSIAGRSGSLQTRSGSMPDYADCACFRRVRSLLACAFLSSVGPIYRDRKKVSCFSSRLIALVDRFWHTGFSPVTPTSEQHRTRKQTDDQ